MDEVGKVLFGAVVGFITAVLSEYLKRRHESRTAAMTILRELDFHKLRLNMVIAWDKAQNAEYGMKFPSTIWDANSSKFLAGTSLKKSESVLSWYASLAVLGNVLSKQLDETGQSQLTGPNRDLLLAALTNAYEATNNHTLGWDRKNSEESTLPLFEVVTH